jgi:hypothetical protein
MKTIALSHENDSGESVAAPNVSKHDMSHRSADAPTRDSPQIDIRGFPGSSCKEWREIAVEEFSRKEINSAFAA